MKKSISKYAMPVMLGLLLSIITATALVSATLSGCVKEQTSSGTSSTTGCGSQMGCCPTTGCGTGWKSSCTGLCYATSSACQQAGPPVGCYSGSCRQCY